MKLDNNLLAYAPLAVSVLIFASGIYGGFGLYKKTRSGQIETGARSLAVRPQMVSRWEEPRRFWGFVAVGITWLVLWFGFGILCLVGFLHMRSS